MVQHADDLSEKALAFATSDVLGLEVAPYFDPFVPKDTHRVMYTDYISTEEIRAKAAAYPTTASKDVPEVDFVWKPGVHLVKCAPPRTKFGYVVASHVMEHVPDPVGWLNQLLSVMSVGGRVILFLPDRRFSSDYFRRETEFYQMVQWWIEQPSVPTPGQLLDFTTNGFALTHDIVVDWTKDLRKDQFETAYTDIDAINIAQFAHVHDQYFDAHCTVWTVDSFRVVFERLIAVGILNVEISTLVEGGAEFLAVLTKKGEPLRYPPMRDFGLRDMGARRPSDVLHHLNVLQHEIAHLQSMLQSERRSPVLKFKFWLHAKLTRYAPFLLPARSRTRPEDQGPHDK